MEQPPVDAERIRALVAAELAIVQDAARRTALEALLVEPRREARDWDYGQPDERYPYWVVAEALGPGVILVHCEHGFGPGMPWGFLFTGEPGLGSLGMDSQWGWYLEEAFVRSGLWTGPVGPPDEEAFHLSPAKRFGNTAPHGSAPDRPMEEEEGG